MLDCTPREPRQKETRRNISQYKCLLCSKKMGPWPNLREWEHASPADSAGEQRAAGKPPTPSLPLQSHPGSKGNACAQLVYLWGGCSCQTRSSSSGEDIFMANSTPCYVSSAAITSIKEMPLLSPLSLLLFGVFQLWKDLLQCFEIWLKIRKGLGVCYCRGVKQQD